MYVRYKLYAKIHQRAKWGSEDVKYSDGKYLKVKHPPHNRNVYTQRHQQRVYSIYQLFTVLIPQNTLSSRRIIPWRVRALQQLNTFYSEYDSHSSLNSIPFCRNWNETSTATCLCPRAYNQNVVCYGNGWSGVAWRQKQGHGEDEMRNLIIIYIYSSRSRIYLFIRNVNDNNNMNKKKAKGLKKRRRMAGGILIHMYIHNTIIHTNKIENKMKSLFKYFNKNFSIKTIIINLFLFRGLI